MSDDLKNRLLSLKQPIRVFMEFGIAPINSTTAALKQLYEDIGHAPTGTCGGCIPMIIQTLNDHAKEEKLW